jgi:hypothetical protein
VSKQLIRQFRQKGLSATDAARAFESIASNAANNGGMSFCNRHSAKMDVYDKNTIG